MTPLFGFFHHFGGPELLMIGAVLLIFFGNRLPSVMRSLGKSVTEFKKGVSGIEEDIDSAVAKAETKQTAKTPE